MPKPKTDSGREESFTARVVRVVAAIPEGEALTYGEVASLAGNPRAARQVVRALNTQSRAHGLPWHRVVGRGLEIRLPEEAGGALQRSLLEAEGWTVKGTKLAGNEKGDTE